MRPENKKLNRYKDVLPFDDHRVTLGAAGYINASMIDLPVAPGVTQRAIMSQGPLKDTCQNFWQMVFEQEASVIVMVTAEVEKGKVKCHSKGYYSLSFNAFVTHRVSSRLLATTPQKEVCLWQFHR